MRTKRLLGAAAAATLLMTGPMTAAAIAQAGDPPAVPTGVGNGRVSSTVLGIDVGDLLGLDLLDDVGLSTIDPANGVPLANGVFNPLKLTSSVLGDQTLGSISTSSTDGEDSNQTSASPGTDLLPIASGPLEGALTSVVDENGARSNLLASFGELDLVGGLLGMGASPDAVNFTTNAAPDTAGGLRGLQIPSLEMLNLGNLLAGIGSPLENLPLLGDADGGGMLGLLNPLGVQVPGEDGEMMDGTEVTGAVTGLLGSITGLTDLEAGDDLCSAVSDLPISGDDLASVLPVEDILGGLPVAGDDECILDAAGLADVDALIVSVEDLLDELLGETLTSLDVTSLLSAGDVEATMVARASDSVETSEADVVASIGSLTMGNVPLLEDGADLTQGADVLSGMSGDVTGTLNGLLGTVGLPALLDVDILETSELIQPSGDYTNALSELRTLGVSISPLVGMLQATEAVPEPGSIADLGLIDGLVPTGAGILEVGDLLGVADILTGGLDMEVGTMTSEGSFTTAAALPPNIVPPSAQPVTPPADGTLPRTGADIALPAMLAVIMASTAVGIRRVLRPESTMATDKLER